MLNLHNRLQHLINLWGAGYHPALCEDYIKTTTEHFREKDAYIKLLEKENKRLKNLEETEY
jgi:hypothetical protein